MVVEWLKFHVPQRLQTRFLEADERIRTSVLAAQPGFIRKQ
ncbi:MAG: TIGR03792 family protein, partial [Meiothermus sp.]